MFWIDNLIWDFIGSFIPDGKPAKTVWGRGGGRRWKKFYNVWANQARAKNPIKSEWSYRKSPKDKYIQDAKDATRYAWRNYTL